ncbi:hypothetical protein NB231_00830 [Nitrococcus mobilis Nb-231]|uniref:Uncharacterized protein n=1 Tax=Nitrococcus mobilis Nb-231 TaxID=314278 RepID=A4BSX7_9GAMM|nr:hypothetical protein NB231_00830 [Nitrococcus mobilis Nb-231]
MRSIVVGTGIGGATVAHETLDSCSRFDDHTRQATNGRHQT